MNLDRIIQMIFRQVLRRGVNAGIDRVARGKGDEPQSAEERKRAKAARQNSKRAKQALRMGKRMGRM